MILLDTDVLIDVALDRAPHAEPAAELLTYLERHPRTSTDAFRLACSLPLADFEDSLQVAAANACERSGSRRETGGTSEAPDPGTGA